MSTMGALSPWSWAPASGAPSRGSGAEPPGGARQVSSLRRIVDEAVAAAEGQAIRRALKSTDGNKSQAARLLRTNYTTLHAKMKRYGIAAREFAGSSPD